MTKAGNIKNFNYGMKSVKIKMYLINKLKALSNDACSSSISNMKPKKKKTFLFKDKGWSIKNVQDCY